MIKLTDGGQTQTVNFDLYPIHKEVDHDILLRFEKEILSIKGVYKVNVVMHNWFECDSDMQWKIKNEIAANAGEWAKDEIQKKINHLHECYSDDADGNLIDLIQDLERLK